MQKIHSRSFYRITNEAGKACNVGSTKFDKDIYLIGLSAIACLHSEQDYYVVIRDKTKAKRRFVKKKDEYGNGPYDVIGKIYFFVRINTKKNILSAESILPAGYGYFIPKGEKIYFAMTSLEVGNGGMFTLHYLYAEE